MNDCSPLERLREEKLRTSRKDLAAVCGIRYSLLYNAERGYAAETIPEKVKSALSGMGVDIDKLACEQAKWIEKRAQALRRQMHARQR